VISFIGLTLGEDVLLGRRLRDAANDQDHGGFPSCHHLLGKMVTISRPSHRIAALPANGLEVLKTT
jgi:hypothetical protein